MTDPFVPTFPVFRRRLTPAVRLHHCRRGRITLARLLVLSVALLLLGVVPCRPGMAADELSKKQMQGLDEQVQEIKSDVLHIASELGSLEEKLLYPSNTQVAVFVSLAEPAGFRLDSLQVEIDGEVVAHHIYTFKELEALAKGGVQRLYTGNIPTGDHQIDVAIEGKLPSGEDWSGVETLEFRKQVEPKLVELMLAGAASGGADIRFAGR